jgi:beta-phosphoglucomutase-like phosphatase (HAD superfamily)
MSASIRPLPGARELLAWLTNAGLPWAIATSGRMETAAVNLAALGVDPAVTPVVTRDQVKCAKPDPDLFLAAAARLNAPIERAVVVGDSIWDMLAAARCRALAAGSYAAVTAQANCSKRLPSASTKTRPTCLSISTSLAGSGRARSLRLAQFAHRLCELRSDLGPEHMLAASDNF